MPQIRQILHDSTPLDLFPSSTALATNETRLTTGNIDPAPDANGPALYAQFELTWAHATAPTANSPIDVYFVYSIDGTNLEDATSGTPGVTPQTPAWTFLARAVTATQRRISPPLALPTRVFRVLIHNRSNQSISAGWTLTLIRVSHNIV